MSERFGYAPYFDALSWMKKNRGRDVTTRVGGAMDIGIHKALVIETKTGSNYVDFVFQSTDKLLHKERCWTKHREKYKINTWYEMELISGGDGTHRIEVGNGQYKLIRLSSGVPVFDSASIRDVYAFAKKRFIKLVYLRIKWAREYIA